MKIALITIIGALMVIGCERKPMPLSGCERKPKQLSCSPFDSVVPVYAVDDQNELDATRFRWIEDNWSDLWPTVRSELEGIASNYAYGVEELEPHITNPDNKLKIELLSEGESLDGGNWVISLEIKKPHGYHLFYVEMKDKEVIHAQPMY